MTGQLTSPRSCQPSTSTSTSPSSNKNSLAYIVVGCLGGILFVVTAILVLVPFARRRASRRHPKHSKSSTSSGDTLSTAHSRRGDVHNRTISADASAPLLEPDPNANNTEYSPFKSFTAQSDVTTPLTALPGPNTDALRFPRRFAPSFSSFSARPSSPDLEPGPSRSYIPPSQPPLRHARTRIARAPMDTLPEDSVTDGSPMRGPSPTSTESHAPAPTSWLHIPKASGIPLIGAFRGSLSSVTSSGSSSLPTMQHYPSFTKTARSVGASSRSSQTFYSVASDEHQSTSRNMGSSSSENGELLSRDPSSGVAARLKPSGVGERIPRVHLNPSEASRQASMVYSNQSLLSAPGALRPDENTRPLSSTVGSGSSLSVYSDAKSHLGAVGEDGRWNGSASGSSGVRGRRS